MLQGWSASDTGDSALKVSSRVLLDLSGPEGMIRRELSPIPDRLNTTAQGAPALQR